MLALALLPAAAVPVPVTLVAWQRAIAGMSAYCCATVVSSPVDVVKTRMQLNPAKYNQGMIGGFKMVIAEEGAMALSTGLGATAIGYAIQGWFKFGGVELLKIKAAQALGDKKAYENKTAIYLGAAAGAEFVADCFLCPLEAARIRSVSVP